MQPANTEDLLEQFHFSLVENRATPNTQRAYLSRVSKFLSYLESAGLLDSLQVADSEEQKRVVQVYASHLRNQADLSGRTLNATWTALQKFFSCIDVPLSPLESEPVHPTLRATLSPEEQEELLNKIGPVKCKHKAVIFAFLLCGLRLGECAQLDLDDTEIDSGSLFIYRRSRSRAVPLDACAQEVFAEWIAERRRLFSQSQALFISRQGTRITCSGLDRIVRTVGHRAGFVLSARMLRDTFIQRLVTSQADLREAASLTGIRRNRLSSWITTDEQCSNNRLYGTRVN